MPAWTPGFVNFFDRQRGGGWISVVGLKDVYFTIEEVVGHLLPAKGERCKVFLSDETTPKGHVKAKAVRLLGMIDGTVQQFDDKGRRLRTYQEPAAHVAAGESPLQQGLRDSYGRE